MMSLTQGFTVLNSCWSSADCDGIKEHLNYTQSKGRSAGSRRLLDALWCQDLALQLQAYLTPFVPDIASLVAVQCTYFSKSAAHNWFVAWHQDRSIPVAPSVSATHWSGWSQKEGQTFIHGPDELLKHMLAARLHLDDLTPDNGPLRIIPNSHCHGTLSREQINVLQTSMSAQTLMVKKGGIILMRPLLLHASSKSKTRQPRRVLHFLFAPKVPPTGLAWDLAVSSASSVSC